MLRVVEYGNPILRKKAKAVQKVDSSIHKLLSDMHYVMHHHRIKGCGLAAPQVGISLQLAVVEPEQGTVLYLINPQILLSKGAERSSEGCLSIPGVYGKVKRGKWIRFQSLDQKTGRKETYEASGFTARIIQHEIDHLNGIVFTDYIPLLKDLEFVKEEKIPLKFLQKYSEQS